MEVFTPGWVIVFVIYCTHWFGLKQCIAVPVPNLANNYHGYIPNINLNMKNRQYRDPDTYHDKFVFPNKDTEPSWHTRSSRLQSARENSDKIYFPDDNNYEEARPVWSTRHRPSSTNDSSNIKYPVADAMRVLKPSSDGSMIAHSLSSSQAKIIPKAKPPSLNPSVSQKQQQVASLVKEFYEWLKQSPSRPQNLKMPESITEMDDDNFQQFMSERLSLIKGSIVSDQSLVSGLKDLKCPPGQVRLANGECRVEVDV